jgi:hypothetical protein
MAASLPTGPFENAEAIYKGLLAMGLSTNAAAGVAGNIYQESHGNPGSPSSAGGGLFGETTANGGSTTGGSLTSQLAALKAYIGKFGSIGDINANASTPAAAATYFSDKYERPGIPDINNRIAAAEWVAAAAQSGNWGTSAGSPDAPGGGGGGGGLLSIPSEISGAFDDVDHIVKFLIAPSNWVRIAAFLAGVGLILFAAYSFIAVGEGTGGGPSMPTIVPIPV